MSHPSGPPHGESPWARPTGQPDPNTGDTPPYRPEPSESATRQMPAGAPDEATSQIAATPAAPSPAGQPPIPPGEPPTTVIATPAAAPRVPSVLRDPLALVLIFVTVIALTLAGLIGSELIARRIAGGKVVKATECVVQDNVSASFGVTPPLLWQAATKTFTNISIHTAGNRVKDAVRMTADVSVSDVRLHQEGDSRGTIGYLQATLTWPSEGIKETVRNMVPILGNLVSDLRTNPQDGTVEIKGAFGLSTAVVKPQVVDGGLSLQVEQLSGLGPLRLPRETLQPELDRFAAELTKRYPLGLHADSIEVTDTGIVARFSTRNASIPRSDDPCFTNL
ncbi:LmeA family phospholipid-binding protein [Mycolicibacter minnesotensis]